MCFDIMRIEHCSSQPISLDRLALIGLVHFWAIKCTKRMSVSFWREIGKLEQCTIRMISNHRQIFLTNKVYYLMVPTLGLRRLWNKTFCLWRRFFDRRYAAQTNHVLSDGLNMNVIHIIWLILYHSLLPHITYASFTHKFCESQNSLWVVNYDSYGINDIFWPLIPFMFYK